MSAMQRRKGATAEVAVVNWLREHGPTRQRVLARFWGHLREAESGCWIWDAVTGAGYGRMSVDGRRFLAHRFSYELFVGPLLEDEVVDHLCRNRACVNPAHLEAVTSGENTRRGIAGVVSAARHRAVMCCPQGHPYNEANTYRNARGRSCRACSRMRGNGQSYIHMCKACSKRHFGNRYPEGVALEEESGEVVHRLSSDGVRLCSLPLSRVRIR